MQSFPTADAPLPAQPTAATHAYWIVPGAVPFSGDPARDRFVGTLMLGPAPSRDFYEQVELYNPELRYDYERVEEEQWEMERESLRRQAAIRRIYTLLDPKSWLAIIVALFGASSVAALIKSARYWWLHPSPAGVVGIILFSLLTVIAFALSARLFPIYKPRSRKLVIPEGAPVDLHAQIQARITPPPEYVAQESPLLICQVCQASRLADDTASGMTHCPNCGTTLPLYLWPIEVPMPGEEV